MWWQLDCSEIWVGHVSEKHGSILKKLQKLSVKKEKPQLIFKNIFAVILSEWEFQQVWFLPNDTCSSQKEMRLKTENLSFVMFTIQNWLCIMF